MDEPGCAPSEHKDGCMGRTQVQGLPLPKEALKPTVGFASESSDSLFPCYAQAARKLPLIAGSPF